VARRGAGARTSFAAGARAAALARTAPRLRGAVATTTEDTDMMAAMV